MVNETAPISEHSYIEDTAEAPVEDVAVEEVDSVEETEDTEEADVLDEVEYATKDELDKLRPMLGRYTKTLDQLRTLSLRVKRVLCVRNSVRLGIC